MKPSIGTTTIAATPKIRQKTPGKADEHQREDYLTLWKKSSKNNRIKDSDNKSNYCTYTC
jgi:hypothetical protein